MQRRLYQRPRQEMRDGCAIRVSAIYRPKRIKLKEVCQRESRNSEGKESKIEGNHKGKSKGKIDGGVMKSKTTWDAPQKIGSFSSVKEEILPEVKPQSHPPNLEKLFKDAVTSSPEIRNLGRGRQQEQIRKKSP
ncbi:hypothetical protein PS2_044335 [Malus domestica]